ncbi:hypothetical protein ACQ4PT_032952 [Festuca glaucescens]
MLILPWCLFHSGFSTAMVMVVCAPVSPRPHTSEYATAAVLCCPTEANGAWAMATAQRVLSKSWPWPAFAWKLGMQPRLLGQIKLQPLGQMMQLERWILMVSTMRWCFSLVKPRQRNEDASGWSLLIRDGLKTIIFNPYNSWQLAEAWFFPCKSKILRLFGQASGRHVNFSKSSAKMIRCDAEEVAHAVRQLGCPIVEMLFSYLGMLLEWMRRKMRVQQTCQSTCLFPCPKLHYINWAPFCSHHFDGIDFEMIETWRIGNEESGVWRSRCGCGDRDHALREKRAHQVIDDVKTPIEDAESFHIF